MYGNGEGIIDVRRRGGDPSEDVHRLGAPVRGWREDVRTCQREVAWQRLFRCDVLSAPVGDGQRYRGHTDKGRRSWAPSQEMHHQGAQADDKRRRWSSDVRMHGRGPAR